MRQCYDLNGTGWQFGSVLRRSFDAPDVDDRAGIAEWLAASVPGNVRTDLLALERIPDPFFGDGYRASLWVEDCDWWYRCSLDVSIGLDQRAFLIFDGIDYLAAVFADAHELGRHQGMFSRQVYEVTSVLRPHTPKSASAEIAVRLWGSGALPRRRLSPHEQVWAWLTDRVDPTGVTAFPDRMATVKCQMSFGWDFAPPMRTMGVWDDVCLVVTGGVFIEDVWISSQLPDATHQTAPLTAQVFVDSDQPRSVQAVVQVYPANFDGPGLGPLSFSLDLPRGPSLHTLNFELPNPQIWEPWDRGFPHLYELTLAVVGPESHTRSPAAPRQGARDAKTPNLASFDSISTRFGVRHMALDGWTFMVNGRREFIRGVNWVPADSLPGRLRHNDYVHLLHMARSAGVNLLRVWGGGLREKRAFYDLCDELGLLVWQEFPFACSFLGYFPRDSDWLGLVERECTSIVWALRNHPSLALWCGGNEFSPRRNRSLVQTLAKVVGRHDGTRPFLPASPSPGDAHNWNVWHGKFPLHTYRKETAQFLSEFGLQAAPSIETLRGCLPEAELWPPGAGWENHRAQLAKLRRYMRTITLSQAGRGARSERSTPASPAAFIAASQHAQALGLQFAIEHMRRRKGETDGVCLWQFNEPWPAVTWAIVDYWRRPKLAYRRLKDLYSPILTGLTFHPARYAPGDSMRAEIWAVNDTLEALHDCQLRIELDSAQIYETSFTLPPDSVRRVGGLHHHCEVEPRELRLSLQRGGRVIARNMYDLTYHDAAMPGWGERLVRWLSEMLLR